MHSWRCGTAGTANLRLFRCCKTTTPSYQPTAGHGGSCSFTTAGEPQVGHACTLWEKAPVYLVAGSAPRLVLFPIVQACSTCGPPAGAKLQLPACLTSLQQGMVGVVVLQQLEGRRLSITALKCRQMFFFIPITGGAGGGSAGGAGGRTCDPQPAPPLIFGMSARMCRHRCQPFNPFHAAVCRDRCMEVVKREGAAVGGCCAWCSTPSSSPQLPSLPILRCSVIAAEEGNHGNRTPSKASCLPW